MTRLCLVFALLLSLCCSAEAKRKHYSSSNTLLKPSHQSLLLQNQVINQMALQRFQNEKEVKDAVRRGVLVALPINDAVIIAPSLPSNRRYVLPMVNSFLVKLASEYYAEFHQSLMVDSAVRSRDVQRRLRRRNRSAAPVDGECASSHETGATVDLSRHMTKRQEHWMDWWLTYYMLRNLVIVEKETHCYHIFVMGDGQ